MGSGPLRAYRRASDVDSDAHGPYKDKDFRQLPRSKLSKTAAGPSLQFCTPEIPLLGKPPSVGCVSLMASASRALT